MPAYIVSMVNVNDPEKYKQYAALAGDAARKYGGKFLARGGEREVLEGKLAYTRVVIAEFENMDAARQFFRSPEYQAARLHRLDAADFNAVLTVGA